MKNKQKDKCDLCNGELVTGSTNLEVWHNLEFIIINDIPADVCEQCGEAYLTPDISEKLDHFFTEYRKHKPEKYIPVPVFSATEAIGT